MSWHVNAMLMLFANFLLFFIINFVFLSFAFLFFLMKYQIFETVNQPETEIGDQKLSAELYEHYCFRNRWRFRALKANSIQQYFKYYYKKEVLHNSKTFSSLFLDLNIFARKLQLFTKTITLGSNAIPVSYLFHFYFGRRISQQDKKRKIKNSRKC